MLSFFTSWVFMQANCTLALQNLTTVSEPKWIWGGSMFCSGIYMYLHLLCPFSTVVFMCIIITVIIIKHLAGQALIKIKNSLCQKSNCEKIIIKEGTDKWLVCAKYKSFWTLGIPVPSSQNLRAMKHTQYLNSLL